MLHHRHLLTLDAPQAPQEHPLDDVRAQHSVDHRLSASYCSKLRGKQTMGDTWRAMS